MFHFAADENFNNDVLRGMKRLDNTFDVVCIQDTEIVGADDLTVLEWAAQQDRILLTHDMKTMPGFVYQRLAETLPLPGVFIIPDTLSIGRVIDELSLIIQTSTPEEWRDKLTYIPL